MKATMDNERWEKIQEIFHSAAAVPQSEQQFCLEGACGADTGLLSEVQAMLRADRLGESLLDRGLPHVAYEIVGAPFDAALSHEFGPYRLTTVLGEGGMGVVWLAERRDAGNLVAIKFLPHAGLSPARRERFAREIRMLGKLKHPYIARLYDAGTLGDGTPWFVMEYVDGVRLTDYVRAPNQTVEHRLRLFRHVCEAVQYAHGQEIIHRDLKPSNILVEKDGTPRLLDFGIARELQNSDEPEERTRPGLRFVSPEYAAPEWIREGAVGFYTDVYSLGVILYEVLAGRRPIDSEDADPERPSVAGKQVSLPGKAAWSDLDVLCLKAMHRDPRRRYQSVEALIRDLDHYLNREPLDARPDGVMYRAGKFVSRNRRAVLAASMTAALMIFLVVFFTFRLEKERNAAFAEAARTRRIQRFMLDSLGAGDKEAAPSSHLRVETLLDHAVREATVLNADPETQAELYETLGRMYQMLGSYKTADELLGLAVDRMKVALGPDHPRTAEVIVQLGLLRGDESRAEDAERLVREGLTIASRRLPPDDPNVANAQISLGRVLVQRGLNDKAIAILDPLVRRPASTEEEKINLLEGLTALGVARQYRGDYQLSESLGRRAILLARQLYGNSHPRAAYDMSNVATAAATLGQYAEAEGLYREASEILKAWYGPENADAVQITSFVARMLVLEGKDDEAGVLLAQVLPLQERAFGKSHPYVSVTLDSLGKLAQKHGDLAGAEADFSRALAIRKPAWGMENVGTATAATNLAGVLIEEKQYARAEEIIRPAVGFLTKRPLTGNKSVGVAELLMGKILLRRQRYAEAESYFKAAYAVLAQPPAATFGERLQETRDDLAIIYEKLQQPAKAARFRNEFLNNQPGQAKPGAANQ